MDFFITLINKIINKPVKSKNTMQDHYSVLQRLMKNHDWIDVKVIKTEVSYQSLILHIDAKNHELTIDDLYPHQNVEKLHAGDLIEISSTSRQYPVHFCTKILFQKLVEGKNAFLVELPEEIGRSHSRQAYRVFVNNEEHLMIDIQYHDKNLEDAKIINLSTEGIKLSFSHEVSEQFKEGTVLSDCIIRLPNEFDIDCDIELRNIYEIHTPHPHLLAGGVLKIKFPQHRIKLEQYLAAIQRQQRRRESRLT